MNKKLKFLIAFLALISFSLISCSDALDPNEFVIDNQTGGTISINFRGDENIIPSGTKLVINEFPQGTYTYETIFEVPETATDIQTEGPVSGEIIFYNGTKALLILVANSSGESYTIFASLTVSDRTGYEGLTDPLSNP